MKESAREQGKFSCSFDVQLRHQKWLKCLSAVQYTPQWYWNPIQELALRAGKRSFWNMNQDVNIQVCRNMPSLFSVSASLGRLLEKEAQTCKHRKILTRFCLHSPSPTCLASSPAAANQLCRPCIGKCLWCPTRWWHATERYIPSRFMPSAS